MSHRKNDNNNKRNRQRKGNGGGGGGGGQKIGPRVPYMLLQERESTEAFLERANAVPRAADVIVNRKAQRKLKRTQKKQRKQTHQQTMAAKRNNSKKQSSSKQTTTSNKVDPALLAKIAKLEAENKKLKARVNKNNNNNNSKNNDNKKRKRVGFVDDNDNNSADKNVNNKKSKTSSKKNKNSKEDLSPEDEEILRLEKLLGIKGDKGWTGVAEFQDDGLADLLNVIDDPTQDKDSDGFDSDSNAEESDMDSVSYETDDDDDDDNNNDNDNNDNDDSENIDDESFDDDEFDQDIDSDSSNDNQIDEDDSDDSSNSSNASSDTNTKSNSVSSSSTTRGKYIPPALRKQMEANGDNTIESQRNNNDNDDVDDKEMQKVRRDVKRLLNKLAPGNVSVIGVQIEELFEKHSRNLTSRAMADEIQSICANTSLNLTLALAFASLIVLTGSLIGPETSSMIIEQMAKTFENVLAKGVRREAQNIVTLWACLYRIRGLSPATIASLLRSLASKFDELSVELSLLLLQWCGVHLRREDAAAFKAIVEAVQSGASAAAAASSDGKLSSRARFMVDSIVALKDNRRQRDDALGDLAATCRKQVSALLSKRGASHVAPLRASYDDLLQAHEKGRWWLVGSAWLGASDASGRSTAADTPLSEPVARALASTKFDDRLRQLAVAERMNTDVRRAVFCTVLDSADVLDACERLAKLGLSGKQEREIVHVLLHCVTRERVYNPFYAQLLSRLAVSNSQLRLAIQFSYWDKFRDMTTFGTRAIGHLAHALAALLIADAARLSVFRSVDWPSLSPKSLLFFRTTFRQLLVDSSLPRLQALFGSVKIERSLRESLVLFLDIDFRRFVEQTLATMDNPPDDLDTIRKRLRLALHCCSNVAAKQ